MICVVGVQYAQCARVVGGRVPLFHSLRRSSCYYYYLVVLYSNTTITAIAAATVSQDDEGLPRRETCARQHTFSRLRRDVVVFPPRRLTRIIVQSLPLDRYYYNNIMCVYYDLCGGNRIPSGAAHIGYTPKCREKKILGIKINRFT